MTQFAPLHKHAYCLPARCYRPKSDPRTESYRALLNRLSYKCVAQNNSRNGGIRRSQWAKMHSLLFRDALCTNGMRLRVAPIERGRRGVFGQEARNPAFTYLKPHCQPTIGQNKGQHNNTKWWTTGENSRCLIVPGWQRAVLHRLYGFQLFPVVCSAFCSPCVLPLPFWLAVFTRFLCCN